MPRFFFQVRDGASLQDSDGTLFHDIAAARVAAVRLAGELMREHPVGVPICDGWSVEVEDDRGTALFSLRITSTEADHEALAEAALFAASGAGTAELRIGHLNRAAHYATLADAPRFAQLRPAPPTPRE